MSDLPGPGIELASLALAGGFLTTGPPGKSLHILGCPFPSDMDPNSPPLQCGLDIVIHCSGIQYGRNDGAWLTGRIVKSWWLPPAWRPGSLSVGEASCCAGGCSGIPMERPWDKELSPVWQASREPSWTPPPPSGLQTTVADRSMATAPEILSQNYPNSWPRDSRWDSKCLLP